MINITSFTELPWIEKLSTCDSVAIFVLFFEIIFLIIKKNKKEIKQFFLYSNRKSDMMIKQTLTNGTSKIFLDQLNAFLI